jgi:hypothetical protein
MDRPPIPPDVLAELTAAQGVFERTAAEARAAAQRRARAVAAAAAAGMTRKDIGDVLGLTRGRVQQIVDAPPRQVGKWGKRPNPSKPDESSPSKPAPRLGRRVSPIPPSGP